MRAKASGDEVLTQDEFGSQGARNNTNSCADNVGLSATSCFRAGNPVPNTETIEHSWRVVPVGAKQSGFELNGKLASEHVAPFPEELIERLVKFYSYRGNVVLDMFGGTGTVAAVARRLGRHYLHVDSSHEYCLLAAARVRRARPPRGVLIPAPPPGASFELPKAQPSS
jgi:hypothetical protein